MIFILAITFEQRNVEPLCFSNNHSDPVYLSRFTFVQIHGLQVPEHPQFPYVPPLLVTLSIRRFNVHSLT